MESFQEIKWTSPKKPKNPVMDVINYHIFLRVILNIYKYIYNYYFFF